jgi:Flp pilus assembly protein TadD
MDKWKSFDGKFDGKVAIKDVVKLTDTEILALLHMGSLYYSQGRMDQAQTVLEGVAAVDPDNKYVHAALGALFARKGANDQALESLNKAAKTDPNDVGVYVNRGEVLFKLGRIDDAAKDFKKALEMDPKKVNPAANRARLILVGLAAIAQKAKEKRA